MQQIFEIKLKNKKIDIKKHLDEFIELNWSVDNSGFSKVDEEHDVVYVLDIKNSFSLKCLIGDLFPLDEEEWAGEDYEGREQLVKSAMAEIEKLPFNFEIDSIVRRVRHVK
jgi:hypothetical protein